MGVMAETFPVAATEAVQRVLDENYWCLAGDRLALDAQTDLLGTKRLPDNLGALVMAHGEKLGPDTAVYPEGALGPLATRKQRQNILKVVLEYTPDDPKLVAGLGNDQLTQMVGLAIDARSSIDPKTYTGWLIGGIALTTFARHQIAEYVPWPVIVAITTGSFGWTIRELFASAQRKGQNYSLRPDELNPPIRVVSNYASS
jgi:hypothetical protein